MEDKQMLELCLSITGSFENGAPTYDAVTGNFDGQGLSVGVLQWNAGQGSLQRLLLAIAAKMGWPKMQTFFVSDIHHFSVLKPTEAIQFCCDHYLKEGSKDIDPVARVKWRAFLNQPESIEAQVELATDTVLQRARVLASQYCVHHADSTRVLAFFFDLITQSGGMENSKGKVTPIDDDTTMAVVDALTVARIQNPKVAEMWAQALTEPLTEVLLHYAFERSKLSRAEYQWDALSRRGAIACRKGIVHGKAVDFTALLD